MTAGQLQSPDNQETKLQRCNASITNKLSSINIYWILNDQNLGVLNFLNGLTLLIILASFKCDLRLTWRDGCISDVGSVRRSQIFVDDLRLVPRNLRLIFNLRYYENYFTLDTNNEQAEGYDNYQKQF